MKMGEIEMKCSFDGSNSSLGKLLFSSGSIQAFGPEVPPFGAGTFGIRPLSHHENIWASPIAQPEVWFATETEVQERKIRFKCTFFGLSIENPLYFSFYIKSQTANIGNHQIIAGGLQRYSGYSQQIEFQGFKLLCQEATKMEVIPLAGDSFWQSQYLAAFELTPAHSKYLFNIII